MNTGPPAAPAEPGNTWPDVIPKVVTAMERLFAILQERAVERLMELQHDKATAAKEAK